MTLLILFTNYPALCELETKHGVEVCLAYHNQNAGRIFCHFIAESKKEHLVEAPSKAKFFSLLMDGSTDTGNIDDELFVVLDATLYAPLARALNELSDCDKSN